jgi:hypothetical protein
MHDGANGSRLYVVSGELHTNFRIPEILLRAVLECQSKKEPKEPAENQRVADALR